MSKRPRQLFVTDMDGTLLGTDSRVSPESAHIISELSRRGALITVATARTPATVEPLLRNTLMNAPAIVMTGASMWDRSGHRFLSPHVMTDELAAYVTRTCLSGGLNPMTYTLNGMMNGIDMMVQGPLTIKEERFIEERSKLQFKKIHRLYKASARPEFYPRTILIFALGEIDRIYAVAEELKHSGRCSVSAYPDIFNRSIGFLEVFAPDVSKAQAVMALKKATGAEQLIVFGDNYNDLPMMRVADIAVAVRNAMEDVCREADEIIGPNSTDSVARYIRDHFSG